MCRFEALEVLWLPWTSARLGAAQEFGDAVAQCVQYCAEERPSAEHLLRHRFFKLAARHPQHLVRHLWRHVPEDEDQSSSSSHLVADSDAGESPTSWCTKPCQAGAAPALLSSCA